MRPDMDKFARLDYPERKGFRETHPDWCRAPKKFDKLREELEEHANRPLREQGHSEMIDEEMVGVKMCTRRVTLELPEPM